jgi:hypothetical protein
MRAIAFITLFFCFGSCKAQETDHRAHEKFFAANNDFIRITGRVEQHKDSVSIYWQGTSILFNMDGTGARVVMNDERGENYFNVVIDGVSLKYFKLKKGKHEYSIATDLPKGKHTLELIKRTEWDRGKTVFSGVNLTDDAGIVALPPARRRTIEFFGNSITSGYANEDYSGHDSPDSSLTNNYYSYAAITARHFDANFYCTSKSGIGIMLSWFPLTMPELYDRLNPSDSTSHWKFSTVEPQVVVINLFQNDSWLVKNPDHESFKKTFGTTAPTEKFIIRSYKDFVSSIRQVYPRSTIICLLGPMDITKDGSPWPGYVTKAVDELADPKILYHFFPYTSKTGHPRVEQHKQAADDLIRFIEANVKW